MEGPRRDWRVLAVGGLVVENKVQELGSHQQSRQAPPANAGGVPRALSQSVALNCSYHSQSVTTYPRQLRMKHSPNHGALMYDK